MSRLALDSRQQLVGSQCSGALILTKLGVLGVLPACTDHGTRPLLEAAGVRVLEILEQPLFASGNVATAGGCLSSHYLATWFIWRLAGRSAAEEALASLPSGKSPSTSRGRWASSASSSLSRHPPKLSP